jgi:hypothetical protein
MVVQVDPPSVEYSQFRIFPVFPASVTEPVFTPVQTVALPLTDPPTVAGLTVIVAEEEVVEGQLPLCSTA